MSATRIYIPATSNLVYIDKGTVTPTPYSPFDLAVIPDYTNDVLTIELKKTREPIVTNLPFADVKDAAGDPAAVSLILTVLYLATLIE